ncbi:hypothetical protein [uncultured Tateyamaria sp.]|uniref:hypothetical protein n=1 Tax=uncultured Tateyamaria sp. TaxID=455651 RepID=UPI002633D388|nr:hypothetical protein [uncultured Tateyamaria sp.]
MRELVLRGWSAGNDDRLDVDIRALHYDADSGALFVGTGGSGGLVSYRVAEGQGLSLIDSQYYTAGQSLQITGRLDAIEIDNQTSLIVSDPGSNGYLAYAVEANGAIGGPVGISAPSPGAGGVAACHVSDAGFLYLAGEGGTGFGVYRVGDNGGLTQTGMVQDTNTTHASDLSALSGVRLNGQDFVIAASREEKALTSYVADPNTGALTVQDTIGVAQGLGILDSITQVELVQTGGQTFAVVASSADQGQMGALSVLRLTDTGQLVAVDHVIDTLDTRFGTVQAMATLAVDDRVYVVAGGGDDGLSLFVLLPGGRVQHLSSLADQQNTGLTNVSALEMVQVGQEVQVFAASQGAAGVTHFTFSVAGQGETRLAPAQGGVTTGTGQDDVLVGQEGRDRLNGGDGDDILQDGQGQDTLDGGAGADLFVMVADGLRDRIESFDPTQDWIDLGSLPFFYDPAQLNIRMNGPGVRITWRGEDLDVRPNDGVPLTVEEVRARIVLGPDRPLLVVPNEVVGSNAADVLEGTPDADDIQGLSSNDSITGFEGNDTLRGGDGSDRLHSGQGNDVVIGGNGNDWIRLGQGNDISRDGTAGNDTILSDAGHDTVVAGQGNDMVQGHAGNDSLDGGTGADRLFGGDGFDTIHGGDGNDTVVGGNGRDLIFLGGGNDVFFDNAQAGRIANDTVWGGAGRDRLEGGGGDENLNGGTGHDLLQGRKGNDTLAGGDQDDTIYAGDGNDVVYGGKGRDQAFLGNGNDRFVDVNQGGAFGQDSVQGGAGNDTLESGAGDDQLTGGAGADVFIFADTSGDRVITDFQPGTDIVQFEANRVFIRDTDAGLLLDWIDGSALLEDVAASDLQSGDLVFL